MGKTGSGKNDIEYAKRIFFIKRMIKEDCKEDIFSLLLFYYLEKRKEKKNKRALTLFPGED